MAIKTGFKTIASNMQYGFVAKLLISNYLRSSSDDGNFSRPSDTHSTGKMKADKLEIYSILGSKLNVPYGFHV